MFAHNKRLQYTVRVNECNPGLANLVVMSERTRSDTAADPLTGAELGTLAGPDSAPGDTPANSEELA